MERKSHSNDDSERTKGQFDNTNAKPEKVKFVVYGEEMIEKEVKCSGNSGRIYLPPEWVGLRVKIIRVD